MFEQGDEHFADSLFVEGVDDMLAAVGLAVFEEFWIVFEHGHGCDESLWVCGDDASSFVSDDIWLCVVACWV